MKDDAGRINEYYNGMAEGVRLFAHWLDGEQFVGTCGRTLKEALEGVEVERQKALDRVAI